MRDHSVRWMGAWLLASACAGAAAAAPPPLADFFRPAKIKDAELSPSGRHLAVTVGGADGRAKLLVIDLDDRGASRAVAGFGDADVGAVDWLDDNRLLYGAVDTDAASGDAKASGLWAVDRDGSNGRQLIERRTWLLRDQSPAQARVLPSTHTLGRIVSDGSGDVIVLEHRWNNVGEWQGVLPHRLDTRTAVRRPAARLPEAAISRWVFDASGQARVAVASSGGKVRYWWRTGADGDWVLMAELEDRVGVRFVPVWVDGDQIYALTGSGKGGTGALHRYDPVARKLDDTPLFTVAGFDYRGANVVDRASGRVVGLRYSADAAGTHWLDPQLQAAQREVDRLLPGRVNQIGCNRCLGATRLLVRSYSDQDPGQFHLFDTRSRQLEALGPSRPWIDPRQMGQQDFLRIRARDGREVPVYVTYPPGRPGGAPAVVLVHGGPHVRGSVWGWSANAQFLASRGYVVVEPEFRGSEGYGRRHFEAGWKQWGLAMQDDVTDATRWAITEAKVDPQRVCIAGASYGGYSALMGLVREPGLYRCAINWVGVTDPALLFTLPWSDLSDDWKAHGLRTILGDPKQDAERFAATSPLKQAGQIRQPLLLAYGGADRRVPIEHGTRLRDAVKAHNPDVEWVSYADEGHGFSKPENVQDFWSRVERFLARHTAVADAAPTTAAAR